MAKAERRFQYTPRTKESVKERANMRGGGFDSILKPQYKRYKIRDGKNLIRVLPPTWDGAEHYGLDIWVNFGIGADNQSYLSLSKMKNESDPIDEERRKAVRDGDDEYAKQLSPRQRVLMWVIDRLDEDEGPQIFDAPFTLDKSLANIAIDDDSKEVMLIDDPVEGCDFRFNKEGTGMLTKYDASKMRLMKPSPVFQDEKALEDVLEYITQNPLDQCIQFYSYEHIAGVLRGAPPKKSNDDDEVESPRPPKPLKPQTEVRKRPQVEEDDDEVEEQPKKVVTKKVAVEPEDDDEPKAESIADRLKKRRAALKPSSVSEEDDD